MGLIKPKILSWNVRGLNERDKRLRIGRLIMFVYKKLNWSIFLGLWCAVYGFVNMWIGVIWGRKGFWRDFLNVGAGVWRKRLRIVWEFFQSHASLEVSLIIFSGLL